jgi:hypothetical protein
MKVTREIQVYCTSKFLLFYKEEMVVLDKSNNIVAYRPVAKRWLWNSSRCYVTTATYTHPAIEQLGYSTRF